MKTSIAISQPKTIYYPGETLSGSVHLTASSGSTIRNVNIDFCGTAATAAEDFAPWYDSVTLISEGETLYSGPEVLNTGHHEWPFAFTIPTRCAPHESQAMPSEQDMLFNCSPRQSLPPSFEDVAKLRTITAMNGIGNEMAKVSYCLKASFFDSQNSDSKPVTTTIPLKIHLWRHLVHPTWDITTQICRFKVPLQNKRRASLTNIFTHRKSDKPEDALGFSLSARVATNLVAGKPIPIFLLLEHDIQEEAPGPRTAFSVRSITVTSVAKTSVRGRNSMQIQIPTDESHSIWETSKQIGSKLAYSVAMQNGGILDVRTFIPDLIVPDTQAPSFATFSIVHVHSLKINVELMYHDRSFIARYAVKGVIVLPATSQPIAPTDSSPTTKESQTQLHQPASPGSPVHDSTCQLRRTVDDDLETSHLTHSKKATSEELPSFEVAVAAAGPSSLTHAQLAIVPDEHPPSFEEAVPAATPSGPSLHPEVSLEETQLFGSALVEEELPGYLREETY